MVFFLVQVCDKVDRPVARKFREQLEAREEIGGLAVRSERRPSMWHGNHDGSDEDERPSRWERPLGLQFNKDEDDDPVISNGTILDVDLYGGTSSG